MKDTRASPAVPLPGVGGHTWQGWLAGAVLLAAVCALQWAGGAYHNEFGGYPDEPAHYVTGLMVRDYIASGFPSHPLRYAQNYYEHYPKVALGNWPPLFYLIQSAWTLPFGTGRGSVMLLMAVLTTGLAWGVFRVLQSEFGWLVGLVGALMLVGFPLVQEHAAMVMTEIPVALLSFIALVFWGRFLDSQQARDSLGFGLFASLAILTKGSGLFLAAVPPLTVLLSRRYTLLKRPAFWWPAVMVLVLCGPWTWAFRHVARRGWLESGFSWEFTSRALVHYPRALLAAVGIGLMAVAAVGLLVKLWPLAARRPPGIWYAAAAAVLSVVLFQAMVPCGYDPRHLVSALGPLVLFIVAGAVGMAAWLRRSALPPLVAVILVVGLLSALFFAETFRVPRKSCKGMEAAAEMLLGQTDQNGAVFLICSDASGEGQFIAEVARRDRRPGHVIRRGSKALASSTWTGRNYQPRFTRESDLVAFLQREGIRFVVLDQTPSRAPRPDHHRLLSSVVRGFPDQFQLVGMVDSERRRIRHEGAIHLYRVISSEAESRRGATESQGES